MSSKRKINKSLYMLLIILGLIGGAIISGMAVFVQGLSFGFNNVTIQTITPAFFFGALATSAIAYLVTRNRDTLLERLDVETRISSKLRDEITERARVDIALKESEQNYRRILDNMLDTYYRVDLDGRITMASLSASTLSGYSMDELIGMNLTELYVDAAKRGAFLRQLKEDGEKIEQFEMTLRRKDGVKVLLSCNAQFWRDNNGNVAGIEGTARDISARKHAESALREREERLVEAQRIARIGSWERDLPTNVPTWSDELYRLLELDPAGTAASAGRFLKTVHPDDRKKVIDAYNTLLANRAPYEITHRFRMRDGRIKWVQARYEIDFDSDGQPLRTRGTVQDITERIQTEEAVRVRDDWLRAILENSLTEIILKDTEGRILAVSRSVADVHGLQREDFVGRTSADFLPDDLAKRNSDADQEVVTTGRPKQWEVTEEIDGALRYLLNAKFPLRNQDGTITGVCSMTNDITDMKLAEEQLRQAQKMEVVGQLTGGVAHDFNNMLAAIMGNLDLIEDAAIPDEFDRESIATALRAAQRGAELTNRLLAFSRQQELNAKVTNVNDLLLQFAELAQRTIGEDIAIEMKLAANLLLTMVDGGQLENALLNLAINARDAMPGGGKLTIETANQDLEPEDTAGQPDLPPGPYVMIAVSDNGSGMPAAVRERVFEPFFTTKDVSEGSGLGLSMVFGFAKQSGGHVSMYSQEGVGTTVRIYLPKAKETAAIESAVKKAENDRPGGDETVLVVEDDKAVRDYLVTILGRLGYSVLQAVDGPAALEVMAASGPIDLLLTDVILPRGMNGREVAIAFRKRFPLAGVIYSSGYTREILNRRGQLERGVVLMNKPYQTEALAQQVRQVLDAQKRPTG